MRITSAIATVLLAACVAEASLGKVTVIVDEAAIMKGAKQIATAKRGQVFVVTAIEGDWYGVAPSRGWIQKANVQYQPDDVPGAPSAFAPATSPASPAGQSLVVSGPQWEEGTSMHIVQQTREYSRPFVGGVEQTVETRGIQYRVCRGSVKVTNGGPTPLACSLGIDERSRKALQDLAGTYSYWEIMAGEKRPPAKGVADLEKMKKEFAAAGHDGETLADFDKQIAAAKAIRSVTQGDLAVRARPLKLSLGPGESRNVVLVIGADDYNWYKDAPAETRDKLRAACVAATISLPLPGGAEASPTGQPASQPAQETGSDPRK